MLRQKKQIALHFPASAESHFSSSGSRRTPGSMIVRVHPHTIFARWTPITGTDNPPVFHGRVERDADGFTLAGTVRETLPVALLPAAFLVVTAVGVILIVLGVEWSQGRVISVVVGAFLTLLFGLLFVRSLGRRRSRFAREAGQLEYGLDTYLRTGEVSRPVG